ncbi:MAG: hypothetical protein WB586_01455 [Chthoniobacterales bacterium]
MHPKTEWDAPNGHLRIRQGLGFLALIVAVGGVSYYIRRRVQKIASTYARLHRSESFQRWY